jgi:hypothetical protein
MATEYSELKDQVKDLVSELELLTHEASTFGDTNDTLEELARSMSETSVSLAKVINESSEVYKYVNDVAVKKTLDSFKTSATDFTKQAEKLIVELDEREAELASAVNTASAEINKKFMLMGCVSILCSIVSIILAIVH